MLPPKASHHAKFHRDRSNQLGDRGWSEKKISTHRLTHTRHPDWLSHTSQHARGTTKNTQQIQAMELEHRCKQQRSVVDGMVDFS